MIQVNEGIFPHNVVKWVASAEAKIDPDIAVMKRPLRNTDPMQSIGVFSSSWGPNPESLEMRGVGSPSPQIPTLQEYTLGIQAFVKDSEEERGLAVHSHLAYRARSVLYTDTALQIVLGSLSADLGGGWTESMRRWGVRTARYFSGEINAQLLYLSTLEFWVETETRRIN